MAGFISSIIKGSVTPRSAEAPDGGLPKTAVAEKSKQPVKLQGQSLLSNRPVGGDGFSLVADSDTFQKFGFRIPS